jgi:hypothetical protein
LAIEKKMKELEMDVSQTEPVDASNRLGMGLSNLLNLFGAFDCFFAAFRIFFAHLLSLLSITDPPGSIMRSASEMERPIREPYVVIPSSRGQ